ncbi:hypothetical protein FSPOR_11501 [Fusarium sporotrichioides]|uniref:Uncharacterized protein n=1 Tax=Fusarium sporotrichioides TaxID=5514 RepID=A0A395RGF9_FUSSP|nr:hypothetical protein FSPOR_11501 [Fusarium sporotrichioides]
MADQLRFQDAKQKFQQAFDHVVTQKEEAEAKYQEEKDMGLTEDNFHYWAVQNYPSFAQAEAEYGSARGAYEAALKNYDIQGYNAWYKKVRQAVDDAHRAGNFEQLPYVAPDE